MNRYFLSLVFSLSLVAPSAPSLSDEATIEEVIGETWIFEQGKARGTVYYGQDTVKATMNGKTYTSTLQIVGDKICTSHPDLRGGKENCFGITKTENGFQTTKGGRLWKGELWEDAVDRQTVSATSPKAHD